MITAPENGVCQKGEGSQNYEDTVHRLESSSTRVFTNSQYLRVEVQSGSKPQGLIISLTPGRNRHDLAVFLGFRVTRTRFSTFF